MKLWRIVSNNDRIHYVYAETGKEARALYWEDLPQKEDHLIMEMHPTTWYEYCRDQENGAFVWDQYVHNAALGVHRFLKELKALEEVHRIELSMDRDQFLCESIVLEVEGRPCIHFVSLGDHGPMGYMFEDEAEQLCFPYLYGTEDRAVTAMQNYIEGLDGNAKRIDPRRWRSVPSRTTTFLATLQLRGEQKTERCLVIVNEKNAIGDVHDFPWEDWLSQWYSVAEIRQPSLTTWPTDEGLEKYKEMAKKVKDLRIVEIE